MYNLIDNGNFLCNAYDLIWNIAKETGFCFEDEDVAYIIGTAIGAEQEAIDRFLKEDPLWAWFTNKLDLELKENDFLIGSDEAMCYVLYEDYSWWLFNDFWGKTQLDYFARQKHWDYTEALKNVERLTKKVMDDWYAENGAE